MPGVQQLPGSLGQASCAELGISSVELERDVDWENCTRNRSSLTGRRKTLPRKVYFAGCKSCQMQIQPLRLVGLQTRLQEAF